MLDNKYKVTHLLYYLYKFKVYANIMYHHLKINIV